MTPETKLPPKTPAEAGDGEAVRCSALLGCWFAMFLRIEATYSDLHRAFGATPESEVVSVMYDAHSEYTKLVAEKVGDKDGWLEWYLWENGGGVKGLAAKAASWKKARKIKTLKDLEALIAA